MSSANELQKLKIMLQLLLDPAHTGTVTGLATTLDQPKYAISRNCMALEKEKMLEKPQERLLRLTSDGVTYAMKLDHKIKVMTSHLIRHGVDPANARTDAYVIAVNCSEALIKRVEESEKIQAVKELFSERKRISGGIFCEKIPDGNYPIAFTMRQSDGMPNVNDMFMHPCTLTVENGVGTLYFVRNKKVRDKEMTMGYLTYGYYVAGENNGEIFTIPMTALSLTNQNEGVFYGIIILRVHFQEGDLHVETTIYI